MRLQADNAAHGMSVPAAQQRSVCMFVYNTFTHDARVLKEAQTLAGAGYRATVVAIHTENEAVSITENRDGFTVVRFPKKPAHIRLLHVLRIWNPLKNLVGKLLVGRQKRFTASDESDLADSNSHYLRAWRIYRRWLRWTGSFSRRVARGLFCFSYRVAAFVCLPFHRHLCFVDYYLRVRRDFRDTPFDIYHAHDLNMLPLAWWLARRHRAGLVYDSHEYYLERNMTKPYSRLGKLWRRRVEAWLVRSTDLNITVNGTIAQELGQRYKVEPFKVIMNTPSRVKAVDAEGEFDLRKLLNIPATHHVLLYLGAITFNRGLECLIKSLRYLPDCELVLLGMGRDDYKKKLAGWGESLDVGKRLHFFGPVSSHLVTRYAGSADIGVAAIQNSCLSYYYCSPNKIFEYILAELPVVASDFPELRKAVLDYQVGLTFDPENPEDIAKQIRYVLDHPEFRENVQQNMPRAIDAFNWENESRKLLDYYAQLRV
jgi:glycosyltransferase involved in cell wall biosynthesis